MTKRTLLAGSLWLGVGGAVLVLGAAIVGCGVSATWRSHPPITSARNLDQSAWQPKSREIALRLATWNVWGLPFVTPLRGNRIKKLAQTVADSGADVVCFQEVFLEKDRKALCDILAVAGLRNYRYFSSPPAGSGLLTVSRYPILEAAFLRFSQGGNPLALNQGDWWAGKGAGIVTIDTPFGTIRVVNTHVHARYKGDHYRSLRQGQVTELMAFVESASTVGCPTFLLGDLNYRKDDLFWEKFLESHRLQQLSKAWSPIDYIFALPSDQFTFLHSAGKRLAGKLPDGKTPFSDHTGMMSEVRIVRTGKN